MSPRNVVEIHRKLDQAGADWALRQINPDLRVIWFGQHPLPTSGLGGELAAKLQQAGIPYYVVRP